MMNTEQWQALCELAQNKRMNEWVYPDTMAGNYIHGSRELYKVLAELETNLDKIKKITGYNHDNLRFVADSLEKLGKNNDDSSSLNFIKNYKKQAGYEATKTIETSLKNIERLCKDALKHNKIASISNMFSWFD